MNSLTKVIAGTLGLTGFGVAVLSGLAVGNEAGPVLLRGLAAMAVCYAIGYAIGAVGERTVREHTESIRLSRAMVPASGGELAGDNSSGTVEKLAGENPAG